MVIRKVEQPKVAKTQPVSVDPMPGLKAKVDGALKNGIFSQREAHDLATALKDNPKAKGAVADYLRQQLETGKPVKITDQALHELGKSLGVDLKELFFKGQAQSAVAQHEVGAGLDKNATVVDNEDASRNRLEKQKAVLESHAGEKGRPIGGSKGAAYDAGAEARKILAKEAEAKLVGALGVEGQAAYGELRAPVLKVGTAVVEEMKRTGSMEKLGALAANVGKPGFKEALTHAAGAVGKDIANASNMTQVNVPAVEAAVKGATNAVGAITTATKGTALEQVVAQHGPKVLKAATQLGAKLGVQGAEAGAQAATAGAEAAGQSVPILGQALGVVTTGLAACELIGHCRQKPKDWKRIIANGANMVGQAVGIFIPFVGAATTAGKLAADAAMGAHDRKVGKETANVGIGDLNGHIQGATGLITPFLEGAGYGDAATKVREYSAKVDAVAQKGVSSTDIAKMDASERDAMMQTIAAAHQELEKAAPEAKGTPYEAASLLLGQALQGLMAAFRKSKNVATSENPEADKKKLDGDALEAAGKAAAAQAMAAADAGNV